MCVVSMVSDHYTDKWSRGPVGPIFPPAPSISREEFESLRKDVLEMKELLKKAIAYDKHNNQPDCGNEEKIELLRAVARMVGVDLEDILAQMKK